MRPIRLVHSGDNQAVNVDEESTDLGRTRLYEDDDQPVVGRRCAFMIVTGKGGLEPQMMTTDDQGEARSCFTPTEAGDYKIIAFAAGIDGPAHHRQHIRRCLIPVN